MQLWSYFLFAQVSMCNTLNILTFIYHFTDDHFFLVSVIDLSKSGDTLVVIMDSFKSMKRYNLVFFQLNSFIRR